MDKEAVADYIADNEGEVLHAYRDSRGYLTIGIGICIDKNAGCGITQDESRYLFHNRLAPLAGQLADQIDGWHTLDDARQMALTDMAYQLGISGLLKFHHMLDALVYGHWQAAHDQCLASAYAEQTPGRAKRNAEIFKTGDNP